MKQNVYAVYDNNDGHLYQFAALETTLAKDAVLAFMEENASALFGSVVGSKEIVMTGVSQTNSIEELSAYLTAEDFVFSMIQI